MNRQVSVEQLRQSANIKPEEAVAIVQQLIHSGQPRDLTPPLGPPTPASVFLAADGSVSCTSSDAPFAVSDLASLLDAMLPASGTPGVGVPGGLRYTIARARMEVDAPPFDSVDDLSRTLLRHERGDRTAVVRRALARLHAQLDRRRSDPAVTQLRRQLRDADARVYDQQRAIEALSAMSAKPPARNKRMALAAAGLIGLTVVGGGELIHERTTPASASDVRMPTASAPPARVVNVRASQPPPEPTAAQATPTPVPAPPAPKRTSRPAGSSASRDREQARPKRFQWLRSRFALKFKRL